MKDVKVSSYIVLTIITSLTKLCIENINLLNQSNTNMQLRLCLISFIFLFVTMQLLLFAHGYTKIRIKVI